MEKNFNTFFRANFNVDHTSNHLQPPSPSLFFNFESLLTRARCSMGGPLGASIRQARPTVGLSPPDAPQNFALLGLYQPVADALKAAGHADITAARVAGLVYELRYFMDRKLGRTSDMLSRNRTLLPMSIFSDFRPDGALVTILSAILAHAKEAGKELTFAGETGKRFLDLVYRVVKDGPWIRLKKIFISPLVEEEEEVREILQRHGAVMVSNSLVATHILYPDPEGTREFQTDGQALVRVLDKKTFGDQEMVCVHWFYHPDSYNEWVPAKDVLGHLYVPKERKRKEQWHLQVRFARDLHLHNEWMNELDYEMPDSFDDFVGWSPKPPKLDSLGRPFNPLIKLRLRLPKSNEEKGGAFSRDAYIDGDNANSSKFGSESSGAISIALGAGEYGMDVGGVHRMSANGDDFGDRFMLDASPNGLSAGQHLPTREQVQSKIPIGNGLFMPYFSRWFSQQTVHEVEKRALPEFFNNKYPSKSERKYRELRNYMVQMWRKHPQDRLTATSVRRQVSGDACAVHRIHAFLQHWGLINYGTSLEGETTSSYGPPPRPLPLRAGEELVNDTRISPLLMTDKGDLVRITDGVVVRFQSHDDTDARPKHANGLITSAENEWSGKAANKTQRREPIEYHCDSCRVDCSALRFHCAVKADVDLCTHCYHSAKYSAGLEPRDFIQMSSAASGSEDAEPDSWTESETLLLLEALEMYGDNWYLVSEHVGSKNKEECVTQFLRLPIEDGFLETTKKKWWTEEPVDPEEISPVEMMRRSGAKEGPLEKLKNRADRQYSGQPLVFGDQLTSVAAHAQSLAAECPGDLMRELGLVMELGKRKKREFWTDAANVGDEELLTNKVYKRARRKICMAEEMLKTKAGMNIGKSVVDLISIGGVGPQDAAKIKMDVPLEQLIDEKGESAWEMIPEKMDVDDEKITEENALDDTDMRAAVNMGALAGLCARAYVQGAVEEAEIERLESVIRGIRRVLIKKRKEHREMMCAYEEFSLEYGRMKACEEMRTRIDRKIAMMRLDKERKAAEEEQLRKQDEERLKRIAEEELQRERHSEDVIMKVDRPPQMGASEAVAKAIADGRPAQTAHVEPSAMIVGVPNGT